MSLHIPLLPDAQLIDSQGRSVFAGNQFAAVIIRLREPCSRASRALAPGDWLEPMLPSAMPLYPWPPVDAGV